MKIFYSSLYRGFLLSLMGLLFLSGNIYSQLIVSTAAVKANFGIDADAYSNLLQYGINTNLYPSIGTDDWFYRSPGSGINVIDTNGAAALNAWLSTANLSNRNFAFMKEMSVPYRSYVNGRYLLDAKYFRDNVCPGNEEDSTIFLTGSNKNA